MDTAMAHQLVDRLAVDTAADDVSRTDLDQVLAAASRLTAWAESRRLAAVRALDAMPGVLPAHEISIAERTSLRDGQRVVERAAVADAMPALGSALSDGAVSAGHVDAAAAALAGLSADQRSRLAERDDEWARAAGRMTVGQFRRYAADEANRLKTRDDSLETFERQRRDCRLTTWTDPTSGMIHGRFRLDPERGNRLLGAIRNHVETVFHDRHDPTLPSDPLERQHHLQALALIALVDGQGVRSGRPEMVVTIPLETLQDPEAGCHDLGNGTALPVETLRRLACDAGLLPAVLDSDGVVLDLGRAQRLATANQRKALQAMYPTCFIPTCTVPYDKCDIHHLDHWEHGGPTDLENLRPACDGHHHLLHEGGWTITHHHFHDTITLPDGTTIHIRPHHARAG